MPDAPDPWASGRCSGPRPSATKPDPVDPEKRVLPGRHALFSAAAHGDAGRRAQEERTTSPAVGAPLPHASGRARATRPADDAVPPGPARRRPRSQHRTAAERGGPISLSCSKCGTHTDVDILKYLVLHLPWWFWRPGRGYTSLMKCPACGQRAWVSASWQR